MTRSIVSVLFFLLICRELTAQNTDTQGVTMQLASQSAFNDRATILNLLQNQEFDEAIDYLKPLLQADSSNSALLGYAGYAYYMADDEREAAQCYHRLLGLDSNSVPALHYLLLLEMNDHPANAMGYANRLIRLQGNRAVWWRMMGELFGRVIQPDSALACYDRAYALAPADLRTIPLLADALMGKKQFDRVDSIVGVAEDRDTTNTTLEKLAIRSAYLSGRYERAIVPGERLVRSDDPSAQSLTQLALSYYSMKRYPDCIRVLDHALDLGLTQEPVYYYESQAWAKLKGYKISDSLLRLALQLAIRPTAEWYYDDLAANHDALKEYRAAVANYDTAYYLFRQPTVLYACGRVCETELHDMVRARRYYLRYLAVAKPVTKEEKEAYGYVKRRWGRKGER